MPRTLRDTSRARRLNSKANLRKPFFLEKGFLSSERNLVGDQGLLGECQGLPGRRIMRCRGEGQGCLGRVMRCLGGGQRLPEG